VDAKNETFFIGTLALALKCVARADDQYAGIQTKGKVVRTRTE
jgi:hypothetical protein